PVAPTERLVVGGLYRYVRNPMYLGVLAAIVGQGLVLGQFVLLAYAALVWAAVATFVYGYEEPTLAARYGAEYDAHRRAVPGAGLAAGAAVRRRAAGGAPPGTGVGRGPLCRGGVPHGRCPMLNPRRCFRSSSCRSSTTNRTRTRAGLPKATWLMGAHSAAQVS